MVWYFSIAILATAILSSSLTLGAAYWIYRRHLRQLIEVELEQLADTFKLRLEEGFRNAALEVLPDFRREVTAGFKDAMTAATGVEMVDKTAQKAAKTGASFFKSSLETLFGGGSKSRDKSDK